MSRSRNPNAEYAVVAEYDPSVDEKNCGAPDDYFYVLRTYEDKDDAEDFAEDERRGGEYGDFHGKQEWSNCGWWIRVQKVERFRRRESAAGGSAAPKGPHPWGIPRAKNTLKESLMPPGSATYRVMYLVPQEDASGHLQVVPTEFLSGLSLPAAAKGRRRLARRGRTAWVETSAGEFVPVKGASKKPI